MSASRPEPPPQSTSRAPCARLRLSRARLRFDAHGAGHSGSADFVRPLIHPGVGEIELVDAAGAHADLLGRYQYLTHVVARLPVMLLQLEHALLEPAHIPHEAADFSANEVGGFAHAGILQ